MVQQPANDSSDLDQGGRNPPIVLHAKPYGKGTDLEWALDFAEDPPRGRQVDVDLPKGSGGHTVIIHLVGAPGITFNAADPIWVIKDGSCPPPPGSSSTQIRHVRCQDKMLSFFDSNDGEACELFYQLNFNGAKPFDPRIRNGGDI